MTARIVPLLRHTLLVLIFGGLVVVAGCSKREEGAEESGASLSGTLFEDPILGEAPQNTVAFYIVDGSRAAYQDFLKSPWANSGSGSLTNLMQGAAPSPQASTKIMAALERAQIYGKNAGKTLLKSATFISRAPNANAGTPPASPLMISTVTVLAPGTDASQSLSRFITELRAPDLTGVLTVEELTVDGVKGYRVKGDPVGAQIDPFLALLTMGAPEGLVFASKNDRIVSASSTAEAQELLKGAARAGVSALRASPEYARTTSSLKVNDATIMAGYGAAGVLLDALGPAIPNLAAARAELPLDAVAAAVSFERALLSAVNISITPRTDKQREIFARLGAPGQTDPSNDLPKDSVVAVSLDGRLFHEMRSAALAELTPEELAAQKELLSLFEGVRGLGVSIRNATGASPFPEFVLTVAHANPQSMEQSVKSQINDAVNSGQAPLTPIQEKEIDGVRYSYAQSMIGIGAFMATNDKTFVIGTGEGAVKDSLTASGSGSGGFLDALSPTARTILSKSGPLAALHVDFVKLAALLQNVQGSLAMFTGGNQMFPPDALTSMRSLGTMTLAAGLKGDVIRINALYEPPAAP